MLIHNKDWKEMKQSDVMYIYDEKNSNDVCTTHNLLSLIIPDSDENGTPTETTPGTTETTTPAPVVPTVPKPETPTETRPTPTIPEHSLPETTHETRPSTAPWYEGHIITGG
jgi:hypothetical protein